MPLPVPVPLPLCCKLSEYKRETLYTWMESLLIIITAVQHLSFNRFDAKRVVRRVGLEAAARRRHSACLEAADRLSQNRGKDREGWRRRKEPVGARTHTHTELPSTTAHWGLLGKQSQG